MKVDKASKPKIIQQFENLLWANTPVNWVLKSLYKNNILYISMLIETPNDKQHQTIRRSFKLDIVNGRAQYLWHLAADCIDEMKTEIKS